MTLAIAVSGPAKCGKDTVCDWLNAHTTLSYTGSTSWYAVDEARARLAEIGIEYTDQKTCYDDRAHHRGIWADVIEEIHTLDKTILYRRCLKDQDLLNGVRNKDELVACKAAGLVDLVIWIDRDVPNDPTMKYGPELCDIVLQNRYDIQALYQRLTNLAYCFGILLGPTESSQQT